MHRKVGIIKIIFCIPTHAIKLKIPMTLVPVWSEQQPDWVSLQIAMILLLNGSS